GERIARRGVILVSVNYRVNVFGYLAHPEISAEAPDKPTNFGHLDQKASIEWVRRNIAAFGGDPENITIFGQSAGGGSCLIQVCSPQNKGLFQRAILHSSGGLLPPSSLSLHLGEAEEQGKRLFDALGVKTLEEARKIDSQTIWDIAVGSGKFNWGSVIGDAFLPDTPHDMICRGEQNDMDLIIGNTGDEFLLSPMVNSEEELVAYAHRKFDACAEEYLDIVRSNASSLDEMKANATYNNFELGNVLWLDLNAQKPKNIMYFYRFDPEIPGWDDPGAFHSSDLWFAFETLAKCWRPFIGKHYDLARQMCNYWTNFARTGDPNGLDANGIPMPQWLPFQAGQRKMMFFGDKPELQDLEESRIFNFLKENCEKEKISHLSLNGFAMDR
ncbi:MAG: carboxylesterase family protein, partial [Verrucomicrobia bacterium]|nr:carboxylesterase family protein [Verrucomicrobiota bacterium]